MICFWNYDGESFRRWGISRGNDCTWEYYRRNAPL